MPPPCRHSLELLRRQEQCFEAGNIRSIPDGYAYCSVLTQLAKNAKNNKKAGINEMAHDVLMMMVRQVEQGNTRVNPSTIDYNIVIVLNEETFYWYRYGCNSKSRLSKGHDS